MYCEEKEKKMYKVKKCVVKRTAKLYSELYRKAYIKTERTRNYVVKLTKAI